MIYYDSYFIIILCVSIDFIPLKIYTLILFIIDLDECKESVQTCHSDADCINNIGSYLCRCKDGYLGNGITCVKGE